MRRLGSRMRHYAIDQDPIRGEPQDQCSQEQRILGRHSRRILGAMVAGETFEDGIGTDKTSNHASILTRLAQEVMA